MAVLVVKADGASEPFAADKLMESLRRAGADQATADAVRARVEEGLYAGITTQELYRRAFAYLREHKRPTAARYSLKRAVLDFGPSGFPFEAYIAELLRHEGWSASIDQIVQGACVEHEVDVVAKRSVKGKQDELMYVEAKFHNAAGFKTDLKVALYVKSRLDDLLAAHKASKAKSTMRGLIVTNTKFTSHAVRYAECAGVELLGWDEPRGATLSSRIEAAKLYPITALTTLNRREKLALLGQKIVLCGALVRSGDALAAVGVSGPRATQVLEEAGALCAS